MRFSWILVGLVVVSVCGAGGCFTGGRAPHTRTAGELIFDPAVDSVSKIAADAEIQGILESMVIGPHMAPGSDPIHKGLMALETVQRKHSSYYFIRQLLYRLVRNKPGKDETFFQSVVVPVVFQRLGVNLDPTSLLEAIAPFAEAQDKDSVYATDYVLRIIEGASYSKNYQSAYQQFLILCQTEHLPLPKGIIIEMFKRETGKALLTCETVYTDRHEREDILLAAHLVENYLWQKGLDGKFGRGTKIPPDVIQTLLALAKDREWWPKMFVIGILAQNPELRDPAVVEALKADADDLVKKALVVIDASTTSNGTDGGGPAKGERVILNAKERPGEPDLFGK